MTDKEIRLRAEYLYIACCYAAVKEITDSIIDTLKSSKIIVDDTVKEVVLREVGILFRFWTTRAIWESLIEDENDAKRFNFSLFRLFNSGFKLPKDDSGIRYAQISGTVEEVKELGRRICNALKLECAITMFEINIGISHWLELILKFTKDAVELPVEQIENMLKEIKKE